MINEWKEFLAYTEKPKYVATGKANKSDDSDWVVLPVASFDAYYGNTNFSRKYLSKIPEEIMERSEQRLGVSRFKVATNFLL